MADSLFPIPVVVLMEPESYSQKVSRQKKEMLASGVNPGSGRPLIDNGETCGTCAHLVVQGGSRRYFKCAKGSKSSSEKSDIRKKWPACKSWEPA